MSKEKKKKVSEENVEVLEDLIQNDDTQEISNEEQQVKGTDEIQELEKKLKNSEEKFMRLAAEYDNYQKRTQREKDAKYADAIIDTVDKFLPIVDNIDRALSLEVETEEAKKVLEGIVLISKQLKDILKNLQVCEIDAVGEEFNPNLHNAVMHIEDDSIDDNVVVEEFVKGYIYKDRVVRHSMVKVAN